jgi:tetratricopeptide (TPR) repeat protein
MRSRTIDEPPVERKLASTTRTVRSMFTRVSGSGLPAPLVEDAVDPAEQARVFEALFHVAPEPERLGRYVVLGKLGQGGMGTVLEAFDRTLDRRVALKVLHRDLGEEPTQRLLREAQALAKLSHPNVVQVYEVGQAQGNRAFIAMELVQGHSLWKWLGQAPRPGWRDCLRVYLQAGEGLAAAHARGLVHRDFKPGNAVIDEGGRVRVLDFGLARRVGEVADDTTLPGATGRASSLAHPLTQAGAVMGTPAYMAPEQLRGREADARSDQFGFCVALYESLYGERPFAGPSLEALTAAVLAGRVRSVPRGSDVPAVLRKVVLRGLALEPGERWPSMEALLVELRRIAAPRGRGWLALGVGAVGMAALGLGIAHYAEVGFRCEGARAQLGGIWDQERRQAVEEAILGTELSYAADAWTRVEPRLDAYASAWVEKHTEICEATSVRQEQSAEVMDLRMGCLRDRRTALREAVIVMAQADETRVRHAVELVTSLPELSRCDDVNALAAELPPPEDPSVGAQVVELRERIEQVRTLRKAGVYAEALEVAEAVVEQAEPLAYAPVLAEALLARGQALDHMARYAEEERDMERAYLLAVEHGHRAVEAKAVTGLLWVVGNRLARYEAALQWGKTALALAKLPEGEAEVEASALFGIACVLGDQGRLEAALSHFERALAIREQALGSDHPKVAAVLDYIGLVQLGLGRPEESALASSQRALAIREQALGPHHPETASSLTDLGGVLLAHGHTAEALTYLQRALAINEAALVPHHPNVVQTLHSLGDVLWKQGNWEAASTYYERCLVSIERGVGPRHPDVAHPLLSMARVALEMRDPQAAREHAERAVSILEATEPPPAFVAYARFVLARTLWPDASQHARARALAQRARDAYAELGTHDSTLAVIDAWLAEHPA